MQKLVKLLSNSLYGENIRKDIIEEYKCKSEYWMSKEYDERVLDYWRLPKRECLVKMEQDHGLQCETDIKITGSVHLGSLILSNNKRNMINFVRKMMGLKQIRYIILKQIVHILRKSIGMH